MTIVIDGTTVYQQRFSEQIGSGEQIVHRCATKRVAQVLAARLELEAQGWRISGLASTDRVRRPLLLPGEKMGEALDGSRSDERAQGFSAWRADSSFVLEASVDFPVAILEERGDISEARQIVEWHLGSLG